MEEKGHNNQIQAGVVVFGDHTKVVSSADESRPQPNPNPTDTDGADTGEEEVIKKVSKFIQDDYLNKYRLVSRNPVKTHKTSLQDIIVKRDLQHLDSEEEDGDFMYKIFGGNGDGHSPSRVLIVGKAFTGKSILCQKYAYDWAKPDFHPPEPFNQFKIVVWLKLCEVEGTLDEILEQEVFRGRLTEVEKARFFSYMKKHPNQFLFLLDGVSECDLDKLTDIQNFLLDKNFGGVYLIATVRPHQDRKLNDAFHSRYCIPGYNKDNIFEYISKFFRKDTKKGEELKEHLENNVNYIELAENPLLTLVLCEVWDEQSELPTITRFLDRYADVVLEWFENKRKFGEGITSQNILSSLENLAGSYLYKEEKSQFSQDELTKYKVDSRVGFFDLEMGHRSFKFSHYKLQLYFIARWLVNNWDNKQLERLLKTIPSSDPAFPTLVAGVLAEKKDGTLLQFFEALTESTCESFIEDSCYCKRMDLFLACIAEAWTETNSESILKLCKGFKPFRKNKTPNGYPLEMSHGAAQALGLIVKTLELKSLNLSRILIPLSAVKVIASECLQNNNLLESVTFSHSCLCPDAVETVCAAFSTMHRLEEVNLSCCNFGDKGLKAVADFVKKCIGQYLTLRLADHLDCHVEKEQIEHAKQPLRREDSSNQIETLSRFQEECASSPPSDKAVETLIEAFEEDVESQEIKDLSLPAPCIGTFVKRWLEVFGKFSQLKRIEIHLKEMSNDLEDNLVQFVNNMLHLEKMSVVLEVEQTDRRDYLNHLSLAVKTKDKLKLTIKDHTQSVKYAVQALR